MDLQESNTIQPSVIYCTCAFRFPSVRLTVCPVRQFRLRKPKAVFWMNSLWMTWSKSGEPKSKTAAGWKPLLLFVNQEVFSQNHKFHLVLLSQWSQCCFHSKLKDLQQYCCMFSLLSTDSRTRARGLTVVISLIISILNILLNEIQLWSKISVLFPPCPFPPLPLSPLPSFSPSLTPSFAPSLKKKPELREKKGPGKKFRLQDMHLLV